jgi:hypothetical protein
MELDGQSILMKKQSEERLGCNNDNSAIQQQQQQPINRVNTTTRLQQLRLAMSTAKLVRGAPLKAYIITSGDEHQVVSLWIRDSHHCFFNEKYKDVCFDGYHTELSFGIYTCVRVCVYTCTYRGGDGRGWRSKKENQFDSIFGCRSAVKKIK